MTIALQMQSEFESQLTPEQRSAMQQELAQMKADLQQLTPEQRTAMQRQAAQLTTMAQPLLAESLGIPIGAQDTGSVLCVRSRRRA